MNFIQPSTNHPLIPNSQEYLVYNKFVSVHSEDRDITKFPNSSYFEIELPEDYVNVLAVRLADYSFPSNYNTFSTNNKNNIMTFKVNQPFDPSGGTDLQNAVYQGLVAHENIDFVVVLPDGFYNPDQIVNSLTNLFNELVTNYLVEYLNENYPSLTDEFNQSGGYQEFVISYNVVNQKIWFGNRCDGFVLTNTSEVIINKLLDINCVNPSLHDFSNWGLPNNLGLPKQDVYSQTTPRFVPRFYYGEVYPGDKGYWLTPDPNLPGCQVHYIEAPFKLNIMGNAYFYMDIDDFNCMDETKPFTLNHFTRHTNATNGVANSTFAKICVPCVPLSQWFDSSNTCYKYYNPPAERIRRLRVRFRYHNGLLVDFGNFNFSFTLEFTLYVPENAKKYVLNKPQIRYS